MGRDRSFIGGLKSEKFMRLQCMGNMRCLRFLGHYITSCNGAIDCWIRIKTQWLIAILHWRG